MSTTAEEQKFRIEKVAPEGGFGFFIVIGMTIPFACFLGTYAVFGLLYNDFLNELGAGTKTVTVIISTFGCAMSFAGLSSSILFNRFSIRSVAIFGSVVYTLAGFLMIAATSVVHLIVIFGILQGVGFGLMIPASYAVFNHYFIKRRVFMMSIAQALKGLAIMGYTILVRFLLENYGFRGTLTVLAAIHSHSILGMILLHPVEWHHKHIKVPVDESEPLMDSSVTGSEMKIISISENKNDEKKKNRLSVPIEIEDAENGLVRMKCDRSKSLDPTQMLDFDPIRKRYISSIIGSGDLCLDATEISTPSNSSRVGIWEKLVIFLDLGLLKDFVYVNIVVGITLILASDGTFFTLLPMYLFELGISKSETATIIALATFTDVCARFCLALLTWYIQFKSRDIFWTGAVVYIFVRIAFTSVTDPLKITIITAIMGFIRTSIHVTITLIFAEHLPQARFPSGYGLFLFLEGNLFLVITPFIGWIRDATQSYVVCFHSLTLLMILCTISWLIERIWTSFQRANNKKQNSK